MNGAAFAIVVLLVLLVLGAGFLVNEQLDNLRTQEIANQVERQMAEQNSKQAERIEALETENQQLRLENQGLKTSNDNLAQSLEQANAARTACAGDLAAAQSEKAALGTQLATVSGESQACAGQLSASQGALSAAQARIVELEQQPALAQPASGQAAAPEQAQPAGEIALQPLLFQNPNVWPLFPAILIALVGAAGLAGRRRERSPHSQATYRAQGTDAVYVKMTRGEAHTYALRKRKG